MLRKTENLLGLDIGSYAAKMVHVALKDTTIRLTNLGLIPLPREAFAEGRIARPDLVAGSVQQLARHLKVKAKGAATAITGHYDVMIKKIELPTMAEAELDSRLQAELGQYIPYNIDEVEVDYQVMDVSRERPNYMDVLLVAAKKDTVADYLSLVRLAGFNPHVIDVDFFALGNAFDATYGYGNENLALIDIGASKAIMSIVFGGVPIFTRSVLIGGAQVTEKIRDHFRLSYEEAERIKFGEIPQGLPREELEGIFVSVVRSWVNECKRAIDFYYSNYPDKRIDKVFLSGGACRIPGLDRVFEESMGAPVEIFNPLSRVEYDTKVFDPAYVEHVGPQMAISLGLALRKTKEK